MVRYRLVAIITNTGHKADKCLTCGAMGHRNSVPFPPPVFQPADLAHDRDRASPPMYMPWETGLKMISIAIKWGFGVLGRQSR